MGTINLVEEFLASTYNLPVVQDITQTKISKAIGYQIGEVKVRTQKDSHQTQQVALTVYLRAENGYDSIGYLTQKLTDSRPSGTDWKVHLTGDTEIVEYEQKTEIILSTTCTIMITINHDQVREVIKSIEMENVNNV